MHRFGGQHTDYKLDKLEKYLRTYTTALKHQKFELIFFDAFAGTGDIQIGDEAPLLQSIDDYQPFIRGSAQRALQLGTAFDRYIFVERSKRKVGSLTSLKDRYPELADRVTIIQDDANVVLQSFCAQTDWVSRRAVIFLDPFGNQVSWKTLEAIANTQAIDLWYLFPAGLGVYRQISARKGVHDSHVASLDNMFGTNEWQNVFIQTRPVDDLFGTRESQVKAATVESVTQFMATRMKTIFKGGVLDEWLPLGSRRIHMYSLMFAWANPSKNAALAGRLARAVLRSK